MSEHLLQRHDLVWLDLRGARRAWPAAPCAAAALERLTDWTVCGYPLVVTRQGPDCPPGMVRLGLPLPPAMGKGRHAFLAERSAIVRHGPPPSLTEGAARLPLAMATVAERLLALPAVRAAHPRLFGSAAMEAVTGLPCLGAQSDLDLLLAPASFDQAMAAARALAEMADDGPRLDGEVRNPRGEDVAWRELARMPQRLLVKRLGGVALVDYRDFAGGFREAP